MRSTKIIWPASIDEAKSTQLKLVNKVKIIQLKKVPRLIAGVDAAFTHDKIVAAVCLFTYPQLRLIEQTHTFLDIRFPYIPGYLSFREGPAVIEALGKLKKKPDLIIFDGQGIAHPKHLGLASHIGVLLDMPSLGCAKSRLVGKFKEPGKEKGDASDLLFKGVKVGTVLRTRSNVKPVFISPGHRVNLDDSVMISLNCAVKYRLPEPTRCADRLSKEVKRTMTIKK